ncbi:MAG: hypothetical protein ACXWA3_09395 [Acidimicrobiales bacterium]
MALRSQRSRRWVSTSCLLAALFVAACGGGSHPETSAPAPSTQQGASSTSGPADGPSTPTSEHPSREYPAGGPTDVIFPPDQPSYELITGAAGCEELLAETEAWPRPAIADTEGADTFPLYESAAYACLGRWAEADRSFSQIDTDAPTFLRDACARRALLSWLTPLMREWETNHDFSPSFVRSSRPSPCPPDDSSPDTGSAPSSTTATTG